MRIPLSSRSLRPPPKAKKSPLPNGTTNAGSGQDDDRVFFPESDNAQRGSSPSSTATSVIARIFSHRNKTKTCRAVVAMCILWYAVVGGILSGHYIWNGNEQSHGNSGGGVGGGNSGSGKEWKFPSLPVRYTRPISALSSQITAMLPSSSNRSRGDATVDPRLLAMTALKQKFEIEYKSRAAERAKRTSGGPLTVTEKSKVEEKLEKSRWPYNHALHMESRSKLAKRRSGVTESRRQADTANSTTTTDITLPASLDILCGPHAKAASSKRPTSYQTRDALTSHSRVMITGILSQVGFNLALALAEQCNVKTIIGMDNMYPNAIANRMEISRRMGILYNRIPNLVRPMILSVTGIDQPASEQRNSWEVIAATGEVDLMRYRPTHIVHLASGTDVNAYRDVVGAGEGKLNGENAYVAEDSDRIAPMFQLRQASASMEHILASIAKSGGKGDSPSPHFVYASVAQSADVSQVEPNGEYCDEANVFHETTGAVDELLASKYHYMDGIYSVGLRMPTLYGPMAKEGKPHYDVANAAVNDWQTYASGRADVTKTKQLLNQTGHLDSCGKIERTYLHVDDAIDSIIAAMQYRRKGEEAVAFNMPGREMSLMNFTDTIQGAIVDVEKQQHIRSPPLSKSARMYEYLDWAPKISFREGMAKLIAWHLDTSAPYGPASDVKGSTVMTGRKFLSKADVPSKNETDWRRNRGRPLLPCASECSRSMYCTDSVFDQVMKLSREVTDGCDLVFYSLTWDINTDKVPFETRYPSNSTAFREMCNVAFIPRDSPLVHSLVSSVSESVLRSVKLSAKKSTKDDRIGGLNGRLLYKGWIILFVPSPTEPIAPSIKNLLKLAPRRLFATSVRKVVHVSGNFTGTVSYVDALFLSTFLRRKATKTTIKVRKGDDGESRKISFPAQPKRNAILVAPVMKHPKLMVNATVDPNPHIGMKTALRVMFLEAGLDPYAPESEPSHLRRQKEFYQYVASIVNRKELRSGMESNYLYQARHWITSKSIVHDFASEEGRQLRCQWYEEHSLWGNEYDQLSFAHVMAMNTLERQLHRHEADAVEEKIRRDKMTDTDRILEQIIDGIVDWREWHSVISEEEKAGLVESPPSREDIVEDMLRVKKLLSQRDTSKADYFVRIFLPHSSVLSRQYFDEKIRDLLPLPRTKSFHRGTQKIFAVKRK